MGGEREVTMCVCDVVEVNVGSNSDKELQGIQEQRRRNNDLTKVWYYLRAVQGQIIVKSTIWI